MTVTHAGREGHSRRAVPRPPTSSGRRSALKKASSSAAPRPISIGAREHGAALVDQEAGELGHRVVRLRRRAGEEEPDD